MSEMVQRHGLSVDATLANFIEHQALPGSGLTADSFWTGFAGLVAEFAPRNRALVAHREDLQRQIDDWHHARAGQAHDPAAYTRFLQEIGYLVETGPAFQIETTNVDPEMALIPGPQLVVPVMNARYALNAANARWGSLYDALYGTDALGDSPKGSGYDAERGARVIAWARAHLDAAAPLDGTSWGDAQGLDVVNGALVVTTPDGSHALQDPLQFEGYTRDDGRLTSVLLSKNTLGLWIVIDPDSPIGATDPAGIADLRLESAITTIMDCEDSVAAVDGPDKALAYANWLGLMDGTLEEQVHKAGKTFTRALADDIPYLAPDGTERIRKGRALMLVRNVGALMTTPAVLDGTGAEIPEEVLDAACTVLCAMRDLARQGGNSETGSIYVVKPKMHGPEEVAYVDALFAGVEQMLGLPAFSVKIGIMDEERRTTVNLTECIRAAKHRVAFINTGFLDRTGDEIHTSMNAGPMIRKAQMKATPWIAAYEDWNVDVGLACGLAGRAQIGKGMWAMPDLMAEMLEQKICHPQAGATTAWVPSPTAATLHATHYHLEDVMARQVAIAASGPRATLDDILTIPLAPAPDWPQEEIRAEIENNAQGILGYVVRWVDQGIGCSKVPDINDIGLMEDRATCRISAQHMANWLRHGIITQAEVRDVMRRMAAVVDAQNAGDPAYRPMAPACDGPAFLAACDLVLRGAELPSGYTEPVLHAARLALKAAISPADQRSA